MGHLNKKQAKSLFEKYLDEKCSPEEVELLESFLESYQDDAKIWSELDFDQSVKEKVWGRIKGQALYKKEPKVRKLYSHGLLKYAAVLIGIMLSALSYYFIVEQNRESFLDIKDDLVVLETVDGKSNLSENAPKKIIDKSGKVIAFQENGVLRYQKNTSLKEIVYNEISVPKGKTFKLVLADGTHVHLNAGTSLRFPVNFLPNGNREVFLLGEAYFEVARNVDAPFIVKANDLEVEVLGTHFNVSSYEGSSQHAVLVEGSVQVSNNKTMTSNARESLIIKPGQKASIAPTGLDLKEVDVLNYIGWTQNMLIFNDELFSEIIQKIERRYNVEIENNFNELNSVRFNGKFNKESIIDLMDTFKESANFDYKIDNGKIIINQKENAYGDKNRK